ncbi:hypothetical protein M8C21_006764 [Ambrosia artemisiifolia]|uniref:Uncharacterized protein n=1 Tax=Ambrosia artemisiifolia TaxID=4212 RepID=A0AAD5D0A0_AMBAR|nr:hypothetical protein M8C21_006764 [Ambrosia artemisiifolia]
MGRNIEEQVILQQQSKEMDETDIGKSLLTSLPNSPNQNNGSRPTSMVMKAKSTYGVPGTLGSRSDINTPRA